MTRSNLTTARTLGALALLAVGCTYVDTDRPGPAVLDDPPTRVRGTTVDVRGFAEPGSTVRVTRDPGFDAPVADVKASEYTGVFRFAALPVGTQGPNKFSFVVTDPAGNISDAAELVVEADDTPDAVTVHVLRDVVVAGDTGADGKLEVVAELLATDPALSLGERTVTFTLAGISTETVEATTDASGRATASFEGLDTPGAGTVTASYGASGGTPASRPASFRVVAGPVAQLTLALAIAGQTTGTSTLRVSAGTEVDLLATATDSSGNTLDVPVRFATSAPGALVLGRRISGLATAGTYEVVAAVDGVPTTGGAPVGRATLEVTAGAASRLVAEAPATAVAGEAFVVAISLRDAVGNTVSLPTGATLGLESTLSPEQYEVDLTRPSLLVRRAGTHRFTATATGAGTVTPVEFQVDVKPAAAATVDVRLSGTDADPTTPELLDVTASAAATIGVTLEVRDAFENAMTAPVVVAVEGGVLFDGQLLRRLVTAGTYQVTASVPGTLAGGQATFAVRAAAATGLRLTLDRASVVAGETIGLESSAVDAFGNAAVEPVELVIDDLAGARYTANLAAGTLVVRGAGSHVVRLRAVRTGTGVPAPVTAPLAVSPATPATATLDITPSNDVRAGEQPNVALSVQDAFSNVVAAPAVRWTVAPIGGTVVTGAGPLVSGGKVLNLVRPGRYRVSATIDGTAVSTDPADAESELRVTPGAPTELGLQLSPEVVQLGGHTRVSTWLRDAYGNSAPGTVAVQVLSGTVVVASSVGETYVPTSAGNLSFVATATLPGADPAPAPVTRLLSVLARPDTTPPTITFQRPAGDPTITAWPPPGSVTPNRCVSNAGDVASYVIEDTGRVASDAASFGGLANASPLPSELPELAFPMTQVVRSLTVCSADVTAPTGARGEVLVGAQAVDPAGNLAVATASWCLDPTASDYLPAAGDVRRCATVRGASLDGVRGVAADSSGDLAVVREAGAGAELLRYTRSGQPYGLGTARTLPGAAGSPGQVAFGGGVAYVSLASPTRSLITRTRGLTAAGAGFDDEFAVHTSSTERISGVVLASAGHVLATVVDRDPTVLGGRLVRLTGAYDFATRHATLPTTPLATTTTGRPDVLCAGATPTELFAGGSLQQGTARRAALFRVTLDAVPVEFTPAWVDTETDRKVVACDTVSGGVAIGLQGATAGTIALVNLGTAALVSPALLTAYGAAPTDVVASIRGLARAGSYLFSASDDGATGNLVRFARDGGY